MIFDRCVLPRRSPPAPSSSRRNIATTCAIACGGSWTRVRDLTASIAECFIIVGVGPLASARAARWIRSNVPGIHIPDAVIARLEGAQKQRQEGKKLCVEIMQEIQDIPGIAGAHVMAYRQEELVAEIVHESGVLKGRKPWQREPKPDDAVIAERLEEILTEDEAMAPQKILKEEIST